MYAIKSKTPIMHTKPENAFELKGVIRLRKLRLSLFLFFLLFLFYLPYGAMVMSISISEKVSMVLILIYFCSLAFVGFWYNFAKCPRCNKFFSLIGLYANGFTSKCLHCGLSIRKKDLMIRTQQK